MKRNSQSLDLRERPSGGVREIAKANAVDLEVEVIASGGAKLCDHFGTQTTMERIGSGEHDAVVIQGQSVDMFYDGESAYFCGQYLGYEARDAGTDIVWFATWARAEGNEFYSRGRGVANPEEMTDFVDPTRTPRASWPSPVSARKSSPPPTPSSPRSTAPATA